MKNLNKIVLGLLVLILMAACSAKPVDGLSRETVDSSGYSIRKQVDIDLIMVGDMLIHPPVYDDCLGSDGYNFAKLFVDLGDEISQADIAMVNQETILGGTQLGLSGYPRFNSPQELGDGLVKAGFDVVMSATNHTVDMGYQGVADTLAFWKNHPRIQVLGINESPADQNRIRLMEVRGVKVAFLNFTFSLNGLPMPQGHPYLVNMMDEALIREQVASAKEQADFVVVAPHWGAEYIYETTSYQRNFTELFAELNVDLVIGTHPHVLEPVEWIPRADGGQMLVYYSLGNYVSNQDQMPRMLGGMAKVTLTKHVDGSTEITQAGIVPLVTHYETKGNWNYHVYKLQDYTEELASRHGVRRQYGNPFSLSELRRLAEEIVGEWIVE